MFESKDVAKNKTTKCKIVLFSCQLIDSNFSFIKRMLRSMKINFISKNNASQKNEITSLLETAFKNERCKMALHLHDVLGGNEVC